MASPSAAFIMLQAMIVYLALKPVSSSPAPDRTGTGAGGIAVSS